jgi:hypothetical protein
MKTFPPIEYKEEEEKVVAIDPNMSPIDYLLARMRDPRTEEFLRTRIAIALLPFTVPKLQATATVQLGLDFASKLQRAMERSYRVKLVAREEIVEPAPFKRRF